MEVHQSIQDYFDYWKSSNQPAAALIMGKFDGLHLGHKTLLVSLKKKAEEKNLLKVVLTFDRHPSALFNPSGSSKLLFRKKEKVQFFKNFAIDHLIIQPFDRDFSEISPLDFCGDLLLKKLRVKSLILGYDACFGKGKGGNFQFIKENNFDFDCSQLKPLLLKGETVSSTKIRELVSKGEMEKVTLFLGRNYGITAKVVHGEKRGRTLGFPTANLLFERELFPPFGVYVCRAHFEGNSYQAVANFGQRPTFYKDGKPLLEVFLDNFDGDLYGKDLSVELLKLIRKEQKFSDFQELKKQIEADLQKMRSYF